MESMILTGFEEIMIEESNNNDGNGEGRENNYQLEKGNLAELLFDCLCSRNKWQASRPTSAYLKYDRIIIIDGEYKKIQIKTAADHPCGKRMVKVAIISRNRSSKRQRGINLKYQLGDYDLLFIPTANHCFLIPFEKIAKRCSLNLTDGEFDEYVICTIEDIFNIL